jgi:hypothetical protein
MLSAATSEASLTAARATLAKPGVEVRVSVALPLIHQSALS